MGEIRSDAPLVNGLLQGRPGLAGRRRRRKRQHEVVIGRGGKRCGGEAIAQRVWLELMLSKRDFLNLNYWYVQAAEKNSPLQFGQAARLEVSGGTPVLVRGVSDRVLSNEFYAEYVHMFSQHVFLTAGLAGSFPGQGIRELIPSGANDWWGGLISLTVRF